MQIVTIASSSRHSHHGIMAAVVLSMAVISNQLAPSAAQLCANEQSSLEVIFSNRVVQKVLPRLFIEIEQVTLDTNNVKDRSFSGTYYDTIPPNITVCIPQNECTRVKIGGRSNDAFDELVESSPFVIRQDGNEVPLGKFYPFYKYDDSTAAFSTTTFVGNCTPTCGINESLMELEVFTGDSYDSNGVQWMVQDASSKVFAECNRYSNGEKDCHWRAFYSYYNTKICLPTEGCYQLVVGGEKYLYANRGEAKAEWFGTFGGTDIINLIGEHVYFTSIEFGSNCETCGENEDWLQTFMFRDVDRASRRSIAWSIVNVVDNETIMSAALSEAKFNYKRECVSLSDTCAKYMVTTDTDSKYEAFSIENVFHLEWGGFVFTQDSLYDADYPSRLDDDKPTQVFLGSCNGGERNPCNSATDSLFELTLEVGEPGYCNRWNNRWNIAEYTKINGYSNTMAGFHDGVGNVIAGTTYKIFRCLTIKHTDACSVKFHFLFSSKAIESDVVAEYNVSLDGIARNGRQRQPYVIAAEGDGCSTYRIVTTLAGRGCFSLSKAEENGIIGAAIGFAALSLLVGYNVYIKQCKSTDTGGGGGGGDTDDRQPDGTASGGGDGGGDTDDRQSDGTASWSGSQDSERSF